MVKLLAFAFSVTRLVVVRGPVTGLSRGGSEMHYWAGQIRENA
jgi:hypothetical protein